MTGTQLIDAQRLYEWARMIEADQNPEEREREYGQL